MDSILLSDSIATQGEPLKADLEMRVRASDPADYSAVFDADYDYSTYTDLEGSVRSHPPHMLRCFREASMR